MQFFMLIQIIVITMRFKQSTLYIYSFRLLAYYGVLYNTILHIPITNAYFVILNCNSPDFQCFQGVYYVHFVFAVNYMNIVVHWPTHSRASMLVFQYPIRGIESLLRDSICISAAIRVVNQIMCKIGTPNIHCI